MPQTMVLAARRYLMASGVPTDLVDAGVLGADLTGKPYTAGWVFSGDLTGDPFRSVESTGKCAIVLYTYSDWSSPSQFHQWVRHPRLMLAIYADDTRDQDGNPTKHDAEAKVEQIYDAVNPLFHDARNVVHRFDDLPVISTLQGMSLSIMDIPSGDGAVRGMVGYDVTL